MLPRQGIIIDFLGVLVTFGSRRYPLFPFRWSPCGHHRVVSVSALESHMVASSKKTTNGRLTKRTVDAATPQSERYVVWDSELKGFGLRVEPSGAETFLLRYRPEGVRIAVVGVCFAVGSCSSTKQSFFQQFQRRVRERDHVGHPIARPRLQNSAGLPPARNG